MYISAIRTIVFGVVSIAQLVKVTDSRLLGSVVEVVSSIPTVLIYIYIFVEVVSSIPTVLIYYVYRKHRK